MADSLDILSAADRLRLRHGTPCTLANETPRQGGSHRVFKIIFKDSIQWAARIPHDPSNWKYELRAFKHFQHIKQQHPEIKAPTLFFEEEHPVLYSEWVSGTPLAIWNFQIPLNKWRSLLNDLAEFLLQLWTTPTPSPHKKGLYSTWLTESLDRGLRRTLNGTARWGNAVDYLIMRSMIPKYAEFDKYPAIGFDHGDLNAYNIMTDDFHLTGVIDWDWISTAPLPAVVHQPWFIANIPGWHNEGVEEGNDFAEDRLYLEDSLRKKELERNMPPTVSTLLRDSRERLFFQSAFHFRDIHMKFVQMYCMLTESTRRAAREQLDVGLKLYPELGGEEGVQKTKDLLERDGE